MVFCTILGLKVCAICLLTAGGKCAIIEWGAHFRGASACGVLGGNRYLVLHSIWVDEYWDFRNALFCKVFFAKKYLVMYSI